MHYTIKLSTSESDFGKPMPATPMHDKKEYTYVGRENYFKVTKGISQKMIFLMHVHVCGSKV